MQTVRRTFLLIIVMLLIGCAHQTSMHDHRLSNLWNGDVISDEEIHHAKINWPFDSVLLDMQEGTNLLRRSELTNDNIQRSQTYLENAFNTFDDLKEPENFSKAFTEDDQTPYRGRPYERMLVAILLALIDASKDRCDMAIPALKSAEFLDARWQASTFGTDAVLVYALMLRCYHRLGITGSDLAHAKDGLHDALKQQVAKEEIPRLEKIITHATQQPIMSIYFSGNGPTLQREGQHGEVAHVIPSSDEDAQAGVPLISTQVDAPCGISNQNDNLFFVLCDSPKAPLKISGQFEGLKLWSSSFQATTMSGRHFDRILKGRADFREGTEIAATIAGYTALALLSDEETQTAGLAVSALAGALWLAGRATNPEADLRLVTHQFESGYLLLP